MSLLKMIAKKMGVKKARSYADKSTSDQLKELKGRMQSFNTHADKTEKGYKTLIRAGLNGSGDKAEALKKTYGA